jgi:sugar phosphate isomerase/epimerase
VVHIHIKDATWNASKNDADYNWPGEGEGKVGQILQDALHRGYSAGLSIEPHMVVVFHDPTAQAANENAMRQNFVEYGKRLTDLVSELQGPTEGPAPRSK